MPPIYLREVLELVEKRSLNKAHLQRVVSEHRLLRGFHNEAAVTTIFVAYVSVSLQIISPIKYVKLTRSLIKPFLCPCLEFPCVEEAAQEVSAGLRKQVVSDLPFPEDGSTSDHCARGRECPSNV